MRLQALLDHEDARSPLRTDGAGKTIGGGLISRGHLYKILSNPIYLGRLTHKGQIHEGPWIPERSATCLREADLNVLSKLGNQGLEWRLEPEAFTRREVRREDDLLDILVGCPIDIQVAWQPST